MPPKAAGSLLSEDVYRRAIALGRTAAGISGPNPPVGCAIVLGGRIVGEGATTVVGGPHAEVVALEAVGGSAQGGIAVVTLEPCAHHGRTGPCVEALISAGVAEVHVLLRDPDPRAAGGVERLRAAGVEVVEVATHLPHLTEMVAHDLRGFLARVRFGRPHVTLKLAQGVDGRTDPRPSRYLTGLAARTRVHGLRAEVDAVLVGAGTVRADDPHLDVRLADVAATSRRPRPVVLASDAAIDPDSNVVRGGAIVLVGEQASPGRCAELSAAGATIVPVPAATHGRGLDLAAGLAALLEHRILTVLAEPGPVLADALLADGHVDVIELHIAAGTSQDSVIPALGRLAPLVEAWRSGRDGRVGPHPVVADEVDGDVILRIAAHDLAGLRTAESAGRVALMDSSGTGPEHVAEVA